MVYDDTNNAYNLWSNAHNSGLGYGVSDEFHLDSVS
jgi:hypothetical protein